MFTGRQTISNYTPSNVSIWTMMAFQAGFINIGGFMACHRFVSHVTGFATFFGLGISQARWAPALGMLLVPVFFIMGAMLSGYLVDLQIQLQKQPKYFLAFGAMFGLISFVFIEGMNGTFGLFGESLDQPRDFALLAILCLICGIQNGTITSVSKSVVRTTHLTGITTDLGLGIVRVLFSKRLGSRATEEWKANLMRLSIITSFGLGSVAGGVVFTKYQYAGFGIPMLTSGILFFTMIILKNKNHPN